MDDGNDTTGAAPELDTNGMNAIDDGGCKPHSAVGVTASDTATVGKGSMA